MWKSKLSLFVGLSSMVSSVAHAAGPDDALLSLASIGKIMVAARDGKHYSSVTPTNLYFRGALHVATKRNRVDHYAVYLGRCRWNCATEPGVTELDSGDLDTKLAVNKRLSFRVTSHALTKRQSPSIESARLLRSCQSMMRGGAGATSQTFTHLVPVTLALRLIDGSNPPTAGAGKRASKVHNWRRVFRIPILVTCEALKSA